MIMIIKMIEIYNKDFEHHVHGAFICKVMQQARIMHCRKYGVQCSIKQPSKVSSHEAVGLLQARSEEI